MTAADTLDPDEVPCPRCGAAGGAVCHTPTGAKSRTVHMDRRRLAADPDRVQRHQRDSSGIRRPDAKGPSAEARSKGGKVTAQARKRRKAEAAAAAEAAREAEIQRAAEAEGVRLAEDAVAYAKDRAIVRRQALDTTTEIGSRLIDAAKNVRRPAGYDEDGRPRTAPVELYRTSRDGERTRLLNPDGSPAVEERPDVVGWWTVEDVERLAKAYGSVVNTLRLEDGKPTGIFEETTSGTAATLGEAGVADLLRYAAENLPTTPDP